MQKYKNAFGMDRKILFKNGKKIEKKKGVGVRGEKFDTVVFRIVI